MICNHRYPIFFSLVFPVFERIMGRFIPHRELSGRFILYKKVIKKHKSKTLAIAKLFCRNYLKTCI